jgi:hypothetical protein
MSSFWVKRSSGADNLLLFLVNAVASVLLTRAYLYLSDYPQIAAGNIHLAHAIFGGLFLSIAVILLLVFHGRHARQIAATAGGLGFGLFIDEVGKFITQDNNYFYRPASVIIYLVFVMLFFVYRYFDHYKPYKGKELMYEVIEQLENIAENSFSVKTAHSLQRAAEEITDAPEELYQKFARGLHHTLSILPEPTRRRQNPYLRRLTTSWKWLDDFTAERRPVFYFLLTVFIIYVARAFAETLTFFLVVSRHQFDAARLGIDTRLEWVLIVAQVVSQFVAAVFMVRGFNFLVHRNRRKALEFFQHGLAINILVTHIFTFYFEQFSAVFGLLINIALFAIVHNILEEE